MPDPQYARDQWLRVKDVELGYDSTIRGSQFIPGAYEVLDKDALDQAGNPLPPDYHLDAAPASAPVPVPLDNRNDRAESAAIKKESS